MTRAVAVRLGLLAAIVVAGLAYLYFDVLQYHVVSQPYQVTVAAPRAGGLYPGGYVAYRGVDVGRVLALHIDGTHVDAQLSIDPGVRIPVDSSVAVHDLSALGEEYVDFVPRRAGGPYLHDGSRLSMAAANLPIDASTLLANATSFASNVDTGQLNTLLVTLQQALAGAGPALHQVLAAGSTLVGALEQVQPQTAQDITSGNTLLDTAEATNADLQTSAGSLAELTAQLRQSDPAIESLFTNGQSATAQLQSLLAADSGPLEALVEQSDSLSGVFSANVPAVQALLAALPAFADKAGSLYYNGGLNGGFVLNPGYPVCSYSTTPLVLPTAPATPVTFAHTCTVSSPELEQRGAAEAPQEGP